MKSYEEASNFEGGSWRYLQEREAVMVENGS